MAGGDPVLEDLSEMVTHAENLLLKRRHLVKCLRNSNDVVQLEKALHVLATLGCDVTVIPPAGDI